jgi:hypothetical protein
MSKRAVYVGIRNPSVIARAIEHYYGAVEDFSEKMNDILDVRREFDLTKVKFLDELMEAVQEYATLKQMVPTVKFKTMDYKKVKKRLRKKVKQKKKEIEVKKAQRVAEKLQEEIPQREVKQADELLRIKNFRKDLENLNKQINQLV